MFGVVPASLIAAGLVVLATSATTSNCSYTQACAVRLDELRARDGQVVAVLRPMCDAEGRPQQHVFHAWLEHRPAPDPEWEVVSLRHALSDAIPTEQGFTVKVVAPCYEGQYQAGYRAQGRGAPVPDYPNGRPFDYSDTSYKRLTVSVGDCAAGG